MQRYDEEFGSIDMEKSYKSLFELLWYSQMPCFDVRGLTSRAKDELSFLKKCFWKEKPISCNAIFNQRPTDEGMCCSFNMKKADELLKESKYREAISERQAKDTDSAFETKHLPDWYINDEEPSPQAGRDKGLTVIIDGHSDKVSSSTVKENFNGFITLVDDNHKFPLLSLTNLISRPGYENNIKVDAIKLQSKAEIRKYQPERRKCYFPDEYELKIHQNYSQDNCVFECKQEFASKCLMTCKELGQECNCEAIANETKILSEKNDSCVPWFYPTSPERVQKMCNPWNTQKFLDIIQSQIPKNQCKHCLPDCTTTKFGTGMTYSYLRGCDRTNLGGTSMLCALVDGPFNPVPWMTTAQEEFKTANQTIPWYLNTNFSEDLSDDGVSRFSNQRSMKDNEEKTGNSIFSSGSAEETTYDAFKKDIGIVNIFFSEEKILKYVTSNRMSDFEFVVQIGSTLGFYMGVSIISIIELIYWFTIRYYRSA